MARKFTPGDDYGYYAERLAEPELLDQAVLLDVRANEIPFAVPVGKLRRGGHIEFLDRSEAEKALQLLEGRKGFPNPRIIDYTTRKGKPADYFAVRWGDPPPFGGCDFSEPICGLLLGLYYGYTEKAIAELVERYSTFARGPFSRSWVTRLIQSAKSPR